MPIYNLVEFIKTVNTVLAVLLWLCCAYRIFFLFVPFFAKLKSKNTETLHSFAILISARNEENVIPHLLDSISSQDYPAELLRIFVVADNCTDATAEVSRRKGATVYERFNAQQIGKGYALNFLLNNIKDDFGEDRFDGFIVVDADNLLSPNYISEINKTFSDGYRVVTSYRNSKNYGDNWISSGYALWFLHEAKYLNHSRAALGTSCAVSGTGFLFSKDILKKANGWNFFLLTEDIEFTIWNILEGETVGYCPRA
ncbi:MAG: glycosyltransferase, partial [Clostridia bacterium]|nr:glycosyltransferase [Clostridia bacterium]